jgi:hypothetical protein
MPAFGASRSSSGVPAFQRVRCRSLSDTALLTAANRQRKPGIGMAGLSGLPCALVVPALAGIHMASPSIDCSLGRQWPPVESVPGRAGYLLTRQYSRSTRTIRRQNNAYEMKLRRLSGSAQRLHCRAISRDSRNLVSGSFMAAGSVFWCGVAGVIWRGQSRRLLEQLRGGCRNHPALRW